jgi:hypothetical protein
LAPDLGGDAWRSPVIGGGGIQALDCMVILFAVVFFANREALTSNFRFLRGSDVMRLFYKMYPPRG